MGYMAYRESISFTTILNRQLDRIAEAASNIDLTSRANGRRSLLNYLMRVRALYSLVKDLDIVQKYMVKRDNTLDDLVLIAINEKYPCEIRVFNPGKGVVKQTVKSPFELLKIVEEILGDIIYALYKSKLLISIDVLPEE